jgi:hypothetical protein
MDGLKDSSANRIFNFFKGDLIAFKKFTFFEKNNWAGAWNT